MKQFSAFVAGLVFGLGLWLAGMADPAKVLAFLDLAGAWDPSLALVMAGAISVALPAFALAKRMPRSWLGLPMQLPTKREPDRRMAAGSLLFGVGWGVAGICPGPALALALTGHWQVWLFVPAMVAGMLLFSVLEGRHKRRPRELSLKNPGEESAP